VRGWVYRGRRAVKRNGGLNRGRRCDDIGYSHTLIRFTLASCISVWDSNDNLRGTSRGSRKKSNLGRFSTSDFNSHVPCGAPAVLCRGLEMSFSERHGRSTSGARHGHGVLCVTQTRPHYVKQMGKAQSEPLATRHGWGSAWAWYVMCELALSVLWTKSVSKKRRTIRRSYEYIYNRPAQFLAQSSCMRLILEGLTWFECCEISQEELLRRFVFNW
jgi:hypothetical protein